MLKNYYVNDKLFKLTSCIDFINFSIRFILFVWRFWYQSIPYFIYSDCENVPWNSPEKPLNCTVFTSGFYKNLNSFRRWFPFPKIHSTFQESKNSRDQENILLSCLENKTYLPRLNFFKTCWLEVVYKYIFRNNLSELSVWIKIITPDLLLSVYTFFL